MPMELLSLKANSAGRRANWKALGLSAEDMLRPKIAVVNSSSELAICYAHLDSIARMVKEEIRAAGGRDRRRAGRRRGRVGRLDRRALRQGAQVPGRRDGGERDHGARRVPGN